MGWPREGGEREKIVAYVLGHVGFELDGVRTIIEWIDVNIPLWRQHIDQ